MKRKLLNALFIAPCMFFIMGNDECPDESTDGSAEEESDEEESDEEESDEEESVDCESDSDCENGTCELGECQQDADSLCDETTCDEGFFCSDGECVDNCIRMTCPQGTDCVAGVCGEVEDLCALVDCETGFTCLLGECIENEGDACTVDNDDCEEGQHCYQSECVPDEIIVGEDEYCGLGFIDASQGLPPLPVCGEGLECCDATPRLADDPGTCLIECPLICAFDEACPEGYTCTEEWLCEMDSTGPVCGNGICEDPETRHTCADDCGAGAGEMCGGIAGFQCAAGLECCIEDSDIVADAAGTCEVSCEDEPEVCEENADCAEGYFCNDGECLDQCALMLCVEGYICEEGQCIPEGECVVDSECPEEDTHCYNTECVPDEIEVEEGESCGLGFGYWPNGMPPVPVCSENLLCCDAQPRIADDPGVCMTECPINCNVDDCPEGEVCGEDWLCHEDTSDGCIDFDGVTYVEPGEPLPSDPLCFCMGDGAIACA